MSAILTPFNLEAAFRAALSRHTPPHQSTGSLVRHPGASIAAADLGVSRGHLHRVLTGERVSQPLVARWNAWLAKHPEFAGLQHR